MSDNLNFYPGADYGLNPSHGETEQAANSPYQVSVGDFSLTTRPDTANQIKEISDKINQGVRNIEVTGISPGVFESIPDQHLTEINRLKKLTGMNLTFHGPILEPTGINNGGWSEDSRKEIENQMWSALERSHKLDPTGNINVTFHSSNIGEMNSRVKGADGKDKSVRMGIIDEHSGEIQAIKPRKEHLFEKGRLLTPEEELKRINEEKWSSSISNVNFHNRRAGEIISHEIENEHLGNKKDLIELYKKSVEDPKKYQSMLESQGELGEVNRKMVKEISSSLTYADAYLRDSFSGFQDLFNRAYESAEKSGDKKTLNKLNNFISNSSSKIQSYQGNPYKINELKNEIERGLKILNPLKPELYRPLNEFAIDKAADTFSNLALNSYKKFKDTAPIISIENPPANQGISRAEDLRELVKVSRKKFVKNAVDNFGMSKDSAKKQAEKLIGVTWDVGHINMIKKFGYDDKDVLKETKKIAPYVNKVHLSDNFGMDHTELPMGMGNVPTDKMLNEISKFNKDTRKVIETGNWYQHFGQKSPLPATLQAFNSPIYSMQLGHSWNQVQSSGEQVSYFSGYGNMLPEHHFNTYGAGFSNLPPELGGQMGGTSRMSGTPIE